MYGLLVVGDDKIGRSFISQVQNKCDVKIVLDSSSSIKRIFNLLKKKAIPLGCLIRMAFADLLRKNYKVRVEERVVSNSDLLELIKKYQVDVIYLFRAGLVINSDIIASGVEIRNTHCASLPEYGGLCSIWRALSDGALEQAATMHRVTEKIDDASVIYATNRFLLDRRKSYKKNEDMAYAAGMKLLKDELGLN